MSSIGIINLAEMAGALAERALAGSAQGRPLDVFIAGDDAHAKTRVSTLIESTRLHPVNAGQLPMARARESANLLQLGLIAHSVKPPTSSSVSASQRLPHQHFSPRHQP